ncbi:MAG: MmcQ/YjbR family DNA-binding protein [Streptosporangiales bacterium]|nr:MmcQ/YjbR family DNA-binding protein [Streptosporangiales bacterium]
MDELRQVLLRLPEAVEEEPFGPRVLVFKVAGKMFAIAPEDPEDGHLRVTLKCDPALALHLRAQYQAVQPGYHTNKRHWNTVVLDGSVPDEEVVEMIDHSYECVLEGLRRRDRERLLAAWRGGEAGPDR